MNIFDFVVCVGSKTILLLTILFLYRVSTGTAHGFGLFDYAQKKEVFTKCTLNPSGKINVNYGKWKLLLLMLWACIYAV